MSGWLVRLAAVVLIAATVACSDDPTSVVMVDRVEVGPANQVLEAGDSVELSAVALTRDGDIIVIAPILWRSLNTNVATLRVSGGTAVVSAKAAGTVRIEAEAGGRMGFVTVNVVERVAVASIDLQPTTLVLERGGQEQSIRAIARSVTGQQIDGRTATWTITSGGNVVSIAPLANGFANVHGEELGEAVIRATIDGVFAEANIQVVTTTPPPGQVASVTITPSDFSLPINHETPLQAIAKDAQGGIIAGLPVTWSVTVDSVARITPIGVSAFASFSAKKPGTTKVRATVGGITGEATVEVTTLVPPPQQILTLYFNRYVRGLFVDQPLSVAENLVAWGAGGKIEDPVVTWEVEDSSIVSIDAQGRVRGLSTGTTRVRASSGDVYALMYVTVFEPAGDVLVLDLTYDWWDGEWHAMPQVGVEQFTDEQGQTHDVSLYATQGSLTLTSDGLYERVLRIEGWIHDGGGGRRVIDREEIDRGTYGVIVGGETGFRMWSTTTPGYEFEVVGWRDAGHLVMRAVIGTAPVHEYLFRMRQ